MPPRLQCSISDIALTDAGNLPAVVGIDGKRADVCAIGMVISPQTSLMATVREASSKRRQLPPRDVGPAKPLAPTVTRIERTASPAPSGFVRMNTSERAASPAKG